MIGDNSFMRAKELGQAKLNTEKKSLETRNLGTNQAQLGRVKFQDIADERFDANMEQLTGSRFDPQTMMDNAKKNKKSLDVQKETLFFKKWD